MKIMQRNLNEALLLAIRVQLRWSERFEDFALYTCVLLKVGRSCQVAAREGLEQGEAQRELRWMALRHGGR